MLLCAGGEWLQPVPGIEKLPSKGVFPTPVKHASRPNSSPVTMAPPTSFPRWQPITDHRHHQASMTEQPQMSHHHRRSRKVLPDCGSPSHFRSEISPASRRRRGYPIDPVPRRCPMLSRCKQASSRNCHPADPCKEASPLDCWCFSHRAKAWHDIASLAEIACNNINDDDDDS